MLLQTIFREYDIRGDAERDLNDEAVAAISRAFGTYLKRHGVTSTVVGGDVRLSTPRIRDGVVEGLRTVGLDVTDLGVTTTPLLYWSLVSLGAGGGVMITGSHNPKDMNGLKLALGTATIYGEEIQKIYHMALAEDFDLAPQKGQLTSRDLWPDYLTMLAGKVKLHRPLKVVIDGANGTATLGARELFEKVGCQVTALYDSPDGTFPNHHPDPQKAENLADLAAKVVELGADCGFGFDGDADRIGVVDDKGRVIYGDSLMALYWGEILPKHPGAEALIEVKCSQSLEDEVRRLGGHPVYCQAGHSLIKAEMRKRGALFSGEYSGHMFFADEYYGFDDSFYAALRLLRLLDGGAKLSDLYDALPTYLNTEEVRIACDDAKKFDLMKEIIAQAQQDHDVITVDGARILYPSGWGLIRASNTQPVLALRCEAKTAEALEEIKLDLRRRVQAVGLDDFNWPE